MSFVYVDWLIKQFSGWDCEKWQLFYIKPLASYLNTSVAPKIQPILHSNLWRWRDLSSSFDDFNLKFVNTCNLLSLAYSVGNKTKSFEEIWKCHSITQNLLKTGVRCWITFGCRKYSYCWIRHSFKRAVLGLGCRRLHLWYTNITSLLLYDLIKPTNNKKIIPTTQSMFSIFLCHLSATVA